MNNIEILEKLVERCKKCKFACCEQCEINNTQVRALENLIKENKELKEENEKLTYARNWYFEHFTSQACTPEQLHKILRFDYIPKSKVKEKIEELRKKQIKNTTEKLFYDYDINRVIIMLKELLEEGE